MTVMKMTCAEWLRDGPRIVRETPDIRVELTDKEPLDYDPSFKQPVYIRWADALDHDGKPAMWVNQEFEVPTCLFVLLRGGEKHYTARDYRRYDTREAAMGDLSDACVAWAVSAAE